MTLDSFAHKPVFAARLTPHRSLGPAGIRHVVTVYALLAMVPGLYLFSTSAWPLAGILVLLISSRPSLGSR